MSTDITRLSQKQQAIINRIITYGRENEASDRVIQAAISFANAESDFNPIATSETDKYKGLFQYDNISWAASFNDFGKKNPTDPLTKLSPSTVIFNELAQIKVMYSDLTKWEDRYDEGKIAIQYKPGGMYYKEVTEKLAENGIDINNNFLHYAYLRHNTGPENVIRVIKNDFTPDNLVATLELIRANGGNSTSLNSTVNLKADQEEGIPQGGGNEETAPYPIQDSDQSESIQITTNQQINHNTLDQEKHLAIADTTEEGMYREDLTGIPPEPAIYPDNQEVNEVPADSQYEPEELSTSETSQSDQQEIIPPEKEPIASAVDQSEEEGWFDWITKPISQFFDYLSTLFRELTQSSIEQTPVEGTSSGSEQAEPLELREEDRSRAKNVIKEGADPLDDNFIPTELKSLQPFSVPNDPDFYYFNDDGKIIKSMAIVSNEGGGASVVVNADNLPATREELLAQLEELGVTSDEAKAIADRSEAFSQDNNPLAEPTTFLGLDPDLWAAMSGVAAAVQNIEQVGDDVTDLIEAFKYGNDWEAFEATVNLLKSLDTVSGTSKGHEVLSAETSAAIQGTSSLVNAIGDLIRLQQAMEDGDEWAIASSTTSMIDNGIKAFNHFNETPGTHLQTTPGAIGAAYSGAAASLVGLGLSVKQMADAFDSGDAIAKMQATLSVVQSGLSTYVAVAHATAAMTTGSTALTGTTQTLGNAMPAIGCAIGVAQGLLSIADGDLQAGAEQIALATMSYVLYFCGPYGWVIALALQLASATRNCDGQIIDTENIENFTDDIAPGGAEAAHAAINIIEEPAEVANDVYEKSLYYSGYDVDMLARQGVDIPNDLQSHFDYSKMTFDFFNPLRYAHYFQDFDEMSIADIWDSLYISQSIASTIAVFYKKKEPPQASVNFTLTEDGQVAISVAGDKSMREAADFCASSSDTTLTSGLSGRASKWRMAA